MDVLPLFVPLAGRKVIMVGDGEAAAAKLRLVEAAGGVGCDESAGDAVLA
ncbi:hypothetical protein GCM10007973_13430 [Polymorphobacter multimanifer]|nr:hypothetical protein [Polymorphobacter multimanifer]GGI77894.1 hypothetical protein GCM10007973_13430 [Polymorphobacter multimanifer]